MENAMPWDTVPSADPENLNRVKPYLVDLQKRSAQRVQKDKDFVYIREDIELYKKMQADKSISLNEAERLAEKKELEGKIEVRKKERLARKKSNEKVYEITLKNVEDAALHPPAAKTNDVASAVSEPLDDDPESISDAKLPEVDVRMEETKKILTDYISLIAKSSSISKAH
jgi:carboxyl-terminal processing protease